MNRNLNGKIAVTTGAARGIRFGTCDRLAQDGAQVIMVDVLEEVKQHAEDIRISKGGAEAILTDVSDEAAVVAVTVISDVLKQYEEIGIHANNAGISPENAWLEFLVKNTPLENWNDVMRIKLAAHFSLWRECISIMRQGKGRFIINITSQSARTRSQTTSGHYAASKADLMRLSRALAGELGKEENTVNCVAPGAIETPHDEHLHA